MGFIDRLVRRLSRGGPAREAELAGDLGRAIQLWVAAGAMDEAARVMVLRGDSEPEPKLRLQHYTQAAATATDGSEIQKAARIRRARLIIALAPGDAASGAARRDVALAAHDLEQAGELTEAADAYAMARDAEGEARALAGAGDVDRLEQVLARDHAHARLGRQAHEMHARIEALVAGGDRREALRLADESRDDPISRSRSSQLRGSRLTGPVVAVTIRGRRLAVVLGREVTIGRTEGAVKVPSGALSRRHALLSRAEGHIVLTDLGSRNGTQLRGQQLAHPLRIDGEVALTLGGEVPLRLEPCFDLPGAVAIEVAGDRFVAPLGDARLGVADFCLEEASDGWVELAGAAPAFAGGMALAMPVTLLRGDAVSSQRDAGPELRFDE